MEGLGSVDGAGGEGVGAMVGASEGPAGGSREGDA